MPVLRNVPWCQDSRRLELTTGLSKHQDPRLSQVEQFPGSGGPALKRSIRELPPMCRAVHDGVSCASPRLLGQSGIDQGHAAHIHDTQQHDDEHHRDEAEFNHGSAILCLQAFESSGSHWMDLITASCVIVVGGRVKYTPSLGNWNAAMNG